MPRNKSSLERAFEIARSGECARIEHIRRRLDQEGYDAHQIFGPALFRQLRELIRAARKGQQP